MKRSITIRFARPSDAERLLEIYAPYVRETAITFEYEVPEAEEFRRRIISTLERYPYLVAEQDGVPVGYAYAGTFHARAAYDWAVETSIYVEMEKKGQGIGGRLYHALEQVLALQNILNANACIADTDEEELHLTKDSIRFHAHFGYRMIGQFRECGYKFDRWYHMVWMEKHLGEHLVPMPPIRSMEEVRQLALERYGYES